MPRAATAGKQKRDALNMSIPQALLLQSLHVKADLIPTSPLPTMPFIPKLTHANLVVRFRHAMPPLSFRDDVYQRVTHDNGGTGF